jgi:signal transduction histidine kinase
VRQRSLRLRLTSAFAIGAAALIVLFAVLAYFAMRHVLVTDRQSEDLRQSYLNAALVRGAVLDHRPAISELVNNLDHATSSKSIVEIDGQWTAPGLAHATSVVPRSVRLVAATDVVGRQVVVLSGSPQLVIDVPIPSIHAVYYDIDNLHDLDHSLRSLALLLTLGAVLVIGVGALAARFVIRRAMAPLETAAVTARLVSGGDLGARLQTEVTSSEVAALAVAFNTMVDQLVDRLERDARFAGDVSHELRSPLTTLATSVEVVRRGRDRMTPESQAALDLLAGELTTFQGLVEDLLEISRYDAGAPSTHLESVEIGSLVRHCAASAVRRHALEAVPIEAEADAEIALVTVDRRRFERVITNLLDNAARYGGGAVAIRLHRGDHRVIVDVDDAGPGVDPKDSRRIFDRFYRGAAAQNRGVAHGTGLGLSLVADHVRHVGGTVELLTSPEGGARFRISLPVAEEPA